MRNSYTSCLSAAQLQFRVSLAVRNASGALRSRSAVAASYQTYLIFAILSVVPDRQRTLRELELGRTLVKEGDRCVCKDVQIWTCLVTL